MKAVLMSIQPKWCELIASGKKTVEVRKTKPKLETPFKVYIYCTQEKRLLHKFDKGERIDDEHFFEEHVFIRQNTWIRGHFNPNGKVIGEFACDYITGLKADNIIQAYYNNTKETCLTDKEITRYANGKKVFYWHISNLVIYGKPKELGEFVSGSSRLEFSNTKDGFPLKWSGMKRPPQSWCYVEEGD